MLPLKERQTATDDLSNVGPMQTFQWTAWTQPAQAEECASRESATALWGGEGQDVRAPGPPAWTSALDMALSWQTPEPAAVIPTGQAMIALQVRTVRVNTVGFSFNGIEQASDT